ncbi:MAG: hypothetical protein E6Q83_18205 [Thiothrix sp.]|nr:MAG: hypothetical protein E6Q83_18205 [Thiothrix sp.]
MLPIIGFDYLDDDYLLRVDDVINAINKFTNSILTIDILRQLEEKGLVKTTTTLGKDFSKLIHLELDSPEIASLELTTTKISKREALKLLAIATGKEKPNKQQVVNENSKAQSLVSACIDVFKKGNNGETPPTASQLLAYCIEHKVQGYEGLAKEKNSYQKLVWKGGSVALKHFNSAFKGRLGR